LAQHDVELQHESPGILRIDVVSQLEEQRAIAPGQGRQLVIARRAHHEQPATALVPHGREAVLSSIVREAQRVRRDE
jgi:hypothetical protein